MKIMSLRVYGDGTSLLGGGLVIGRAARYQAISSLSGGRGRVIALALRCHRIIRLALQKDNALSGWNLVMG